MDHSGMIRALEAAIDLIAAIRDVDDEEAFMCTVELIRARVRSCEEWLAAKKAMTRLDKTYTQENSRKLFLIELASL